MQLIVVWQWRVYYNISVLLLHTLGGHFAHQKRVAIEGSVVAPVQTFTARVPGGWFSVVWLRLVNAGCHDSGFQSVTRITVHIDDKKLHVQVHEGGRSTRSSKASVCN